MFVASVDTHLRPHATGSFGLSSSFATFNPCLLGALRWESPQRERKLLSLSRLALPPKRSHSKRSISRHERRTKTKAFAGSDTQRSPATTAYERVLRYPDGRERRIRYPVPQEDDAWTTYIDAGDSHDTLNAWKTRERPKQDEFRGQPTSKVATTKGRRTLAEDHASTQERTNLPSSEPVETEVDGRDDDIPDSPLALLRKLTSPDHRDAQRKEMEELRNSYDILQGAPWPIPRSLFLLAAARPGEGVGLTHTLRTRIPREDLEDEMERLLGKKNRNRKDLPLISCEEVVDGVVAFEDESMAENYGEGLERDFEGMRVSLVDCNSHELFRTVQEVRGVVVLIKRGSKVPDSRTLAACLRSRAPIDDA